MKRNELKKTPGTGGKGKGRAPKRQTVSIQCFATAADERLLSEKELADALGVALSTVSRWRKAGKIPFYQIGRTLFFKLSEVLENAKKGATS